MASLLSLRPLYYNRPLAHRLLGHNGYYQRTFSATTRSRGPITDFVVAGPTALIDAIHSTGLPYCATIPLTAVLVRTVLVYYLSTRPARRRARLFNHILPLLEADAYAHQASPSAMPLHQGVARKQGVGRAIAMLRRGTNFAFHGFQTRRKYAKMFRFGRAPLPFLNFGILIAFTESIRLKCGSSGGLLSFLLSPLESIGRTESGSPPVDPAEVLAAKLQAAREAMIAQTRGGDAVDLSLTPISRTTAHLWART